MRDALRAVRAGQGAQLALDFLREVQDAHEVRVHVGEFAQSTLFAAAMLEDTSGLFDEAAAFLRRCLQDGIQAPLPNDDVHLAPHARVRQQLLDV